MSIRLYYSHRTEDLAEKLAANIRTESRDADPFIKSTIIIPNKNIEKWLKMKIAQHNGISANIDFPFLEKGLWNILSRVDPGEAKPQLLTENMAQMLVLGELMSLGSTDKDMQPLRWYLYRGSKDRPVDYYRKAWQLSEKLAKVFREYEYNRQKLIDAWREGRYYYTEGSHNLKSMERCQRELYLRVFLPDGSRDASGSLNGKNYITLPQYERLVFRGDKHKSGKNIGLLPIHIFGLSQISEFHIRLLFEIGRFFDVRLYQINVCSEFWEDVTTPQEDNYRKFKDMAVKEGSFGEYLEDGTIDNRLLKLWGKPGRENVKLLSELEESCAGKVEFDAGWVLPDRRDRYEKNTVLTTVQDRILQRRDKPEKIAQDVSIQIIGAPGICREAETVYNSIIDNMKKDPTLLLTDIAVLVPSMHDYGPTLKTVFSHEPQVIPFNMNDVCAADESIYVQAVLAMLELIDSSFSRKKVFSLFLNDCFLAAAKVSREDVLVWLKWADRLNIFHSFDEEDKKRHSLPPNPIYTWQQGLVRLRMGRIMDTVNCQDDQNTHAYKGMVPFFDIESSDSKMVSDFSVAVEMLGSRITRLAGKAMTCKEWSIQLRSLIDQFITVPYGRNEENRIEMNFKYALEELEGLDKVLGAAAKNGLGFGFVSEYIKSYVARISASHGKYLAGGVTISSLLPMRPIPFRIVYIMGLGEGGFPGTPDRSTLDLRHYKRKIGDVSIDEANRYLFLETVMSVREKLYLTYISRDVQKDEILYPCSVVNELRGYLDDHILKSGFNTLKDEFPDWLDDIPLKGSSANYLIDPQKLPRWSDILVNYSVADRLSCLSELADSGRIHLKAALEGEMARKRKELIKWDFISTAKTPIGPAGSKEMLPVRIKDLADFLTDPVGASLKRHLGIYDDTDEDLLSAEDEPFRSTYPVERLLTTGMAEAFIDSWQNAGSARKDPEKFLDDNFEKLYENYHLSGKTPDDIFCEVDKRKLKESLKNMIQSGASLKSFLEAHAGSSYYRNMAIGSSASKIAADARYSCLTLKVQLNDGKTKSVDLHGELPFVWLDRSSAKYETLVLKRKIPSPGAISRDILKPVLFCMALQASGNAAKNASFTVHLADQTGIVDSRKFAVTPHDARWYLIKLTGEYLDDKLFDLLPLDIIKKTLKTLRSDVKPCKEEADAYRIRLEEEISLAATNPYSSYRPSEVISALGLKVPEDAYVKVAGRIKWICDKFDE